MTGIPVKLHAIVIVCSWDLSRFVPSHKTGIHIATQTYPHAYHMYMYMYRDCILLDKEEKEKEEKEKKEKKRTIDRLK